MGAEIEELSRQLMNAVETVMNSSADQQQRLQAHQLCEDFKENSPYCVQCGLFLAAQTNPPIARNFGLQLMEHCIKYRWNNLTLDEKIFIKDNTMKLLASGTNHILVEPVYIKNALSKIMVEMIKREWPQHWPELLSELHQLCQMGETQTELVLLTLLRLVEDTVAFQNIHPQRRREIYQVLVANMSDIFGLFLELLHHHTSKFTTMKEATDEAAAHCRVAQAVLETLTAFVEWVPISHIMANNGILLQTLCLLLANQDLQLAAAECLLQIVNRKGKPDDRQPLLVLFNEAPMQAIFHAASDAANACLEERYYIFLKRLCQVLIGIGSQLCYLWGSVDNIGQPPNFKMYLDAILAFTHHPSLVLSGFTQSLWACFFRHDAISQDPILQSYIPKVAEVAWNKLIKVGYPSRTDSHRSSFSRMEFDSDEDFNQFFPKYRSEVADTIRLATILCPTVTFEFASSWLQEQLQKPIDIGETNTESALCNLSSPAFLEWDALSLYLESVLGRILQTDKPKPSAEKGIELLKAVLEYETQDPLILSCTLSCISALFVFLTMAPETLPAVLKKIFSTLVFSLPGQTKATRSRAVKNVRRHACSSLVKICKQYPVLLMSSFDLIYMHLKQLSSDQEQLSQMEKCTLLEALILLSNQFHDFRKQSSFIKEIMLPIHTFWLCKETQEAFSTAENFMSYIGLDEAPVEPSNDDIVGINRSQIIFCVNTILAVIKRSRWPDDMELAHKGNFVRESNASPSGIVLCNPSTAHVLPTIPNLFLLMRAFNNLWLSDAQKKVSSEYMHSHDMLEVDKNNVLGASFKCHEWPQDEKSGWKLRLKGLEKGRNIGINPPCVDLTDVPITKQPLERMQHFLTNVHDTCYHVLGSAGPSLAYEFYSIPQLADYIISSVLDNIDIIPDYRLRPIIRVFMKQFVQHCPSECYSSAVIPVLVQLCPYMFQRLHNKWLNLQQKLENSVANEDDNPESQEVLEDQLNRQLTREYIELLGAVLHGRRGTVVDNMMDMMDEDMDHGSGPPHSDSLSDLGQLILKHEVLCPAISKCCFQALAWNDATSCNKSLSLCSLILKQLVATTVVSPEDAKELLACVLLGLQRHGQHEANQSCLLNLGLQVYEALRPIHPGVTAVLMEIPECSLQDIENLDERLLQCNPNKPIPEKKKKEMFKKLVINIIGQNIGQAFKKSVYIKNLPPLAYTPKIKARTLLEEASTHLCRLFDDNNAQDGIHS